MYQALYRKYRPKNFDEVVGQNVIVETLKNSILNNKISHAYLFTGPRGSGKTSIAKIFARVVNCQNPENAQACNKCVCCTQNNEQNLDIIEMDAASNNGVDEIREIKNKVNLVPSLGKYKVYIIDEVHMLTIGAFNALLKTLEEPPSHVIFILATTDPHKVPITILSRCQRYDLKKISSELISDRLKYICNQEKIEIDNEALEEISRLGDGSLRDAISILDQVISYTSQTITLEDVHNVNGTISQKEISLFINSIINQNFIEIINTIKNYNDKGKSIIKITEEIIYFFRNSLISKIDKNYFENGNLYEECYKNYSEEKIIEIINILNETLLDMKKYSDAKMLLELAVIKIINKEKKLPELNNKNFEIKPNKNLEAKESLTVNKKTENIISEEINNDMIEKINEFVRIRVNNTLSMFSKKDTITLKNSVKLVNDYIMDDSYGTFASMVLDGEVKATGNNYIIFAFKTSNLANSFNESIIQIEELLSKVLNNKYKVIAVDDISWNEIKEKFNNKTEKFEYKEEYINIEDLLSNIKKDSDSDVESLFGNIVLYNN